MATDEFSSRSTLSVGDRKLEIHRLDALQEQWDVARLPYTLRILLENVLRTGDRSDVEAVAGWVATDEPNREISFAPARVLLQDFTGVPAVVDLAAMRDAMADLGGDPEQINPLIPVELVIDHSVQVDVFGSRSAFVRNVEFEFERNRERYAFLRWGQKGFRDFKVVPPGTGIVHQVNLEFLARVVEERDGWAFPDTLVGTDSHTTMVNGLGVLGWGVGGIEAEAAKLGEPLSMLVPQVVGFKLTGAAPRRRDGNRPRPDRHADPAPGGRGREVRRVLRARARRPPPRRSRDDREHVAGVRRDLRLLPRRRPNAQLPAPHRPQRGTARARRGVLQGEHALARPGRGADLLAGCRARPLDRRTVAGRPAPPAGPRAATHAKTAFLDSLGTFGVKDPMKNGSHDQAVADTFPASDPTTEQAPGGSPEPVPDATPVAVVGPGRTAVPVKGTDYALEHGRVVIAAITSCTNTSNPQVMVGAGLLAKKAIERGLSSKPWVKTSLAPGSKVVTEYYDRAGLTDYLEQLGFHTVGYGCTTCIGNSGPLPEEISVAVEEGDLVVCSVLSGNRNFEARIHPEVKANYLASPPLVVAYALAGRMDIDLLEEPLGEDQDGNEVYLRDIWPTSKEITDTIATSVHGEMFRSTYADVFTGDEQWRSLPVPEGERFAWEPDSTYVRQPPYFEGMSLEIAPVEDIAGARCLVMLGDSVTTDHISPAGAIKLESPAGEYLREHGVERKDFNSYGSRRGNHEVMVRGTFANVRLRNLLVPGSEGTWTVHLPGGEEMTIFEASQRYLAEGTPLIVIAGKEYGSGSSRDWAAKGPKLLGVKAVIAESYERIHRSNLLMMGILPLQFQAGETPETLGLTGREAFAIEGVENGEADEVTVRADDKTFRARVRLDTPRERDYLRHGGILPFVLRRLLAA